MAWYRAGSVTVTNGSAVVTGAGTSFVSNVQAGHAINLSDGRSYEVLSVDSNGQLTLGSPYLGGTAGGQPYSVQPNQGFAQTAAVRLSDFLSQVSGWVAGVLAGRFADGSTAVPGMCFAADQDTGFARLGDNTAALIAGGVAHLTVSPSGVSLSNLIDRTKLGNAGRMMPGSLVELSSYQLISFNAKFNSSTYTGVAHAGAPGNDETLYLQSGSGGIALRTGGNVDRVIVDPTGNLLVGVGNGSAHLFNKPAAQGAQLAGFFSTVASNTSMDVFVCGGAGANGSSTAVKLGSNTATGRSINAGGTVNANGADYAEYMTKADGCGTIAAGDVCGIDAAGKLTKSWAAAISFAVKSTDPAYVGGDIWAAHLPPKPVDPGTAPAAPAPLGVKPADDDEGYANWRAAADAYPALVAAHRAALADWQAAKAAYDVDLPAWEMDLEASRQTVDRIAFCGQVPVNIDGDFAIGDYLIAAAKGGGIHAVAVAEADITFAQYRRRLGKVWAIRGGRPWIDVQHG